MWRVTAKDWPGSALSAKLISTMAYLGIDIGGTKTLVCRLSDDGQILTQDKFATPHDYKEFTEQLRQTVETIDLSDVIAVGVGAPGVLDRDNNLVTSFGNLPWKNVPIRPDVAQILNKPTVIENDAKLAGLYEAVLLKDRYDRVLYITISTGIGLGLTVDGVIQHDVRDEGGLSMIYEHNGELQAWEKFASGRAIFEEFGQRASDISDPAIWQEVSRRLVPGFTELITLLTPDVITIGGGVGAHYEKFEHIFEPLLEQYLTPDIKRPDIIKAANAEEAVILGCHELAKQTYGTQTH